MPLSKDLREFVEWLNSDASISTRFRNSSKT